MIWQSKYCHWTVHSTVGTHGARGCGSVWRIWIEEGWFCIWRDFDDDDNFYLHEEVEEVKKKSTIFFLNIFKPELQCLPFLCPPPGPRTSALASRLCPIYFYMTFFVFVLFCFYYEKFQTYTKLEANIITPMCMPSSFNHYQYLAIGLYWAYYL